MDFPKMSDFPIGEPNDAYAKYFTGQSYLSFVGTKEAPLANVTFEPGCRNNWHIHDSKEGGGQLLICVYGEGIYQEWGKDPVHLKPGSVVYIRPGVKHWHGATSSSWFQHLAMEMPGKGLSTEWCEPVNDEEYASANKRIKEIKQ